jgi:WD40 repeat protein
LVLISWLFDLLQGHREAIQSLSVDRETGQFVTSCLDGKVTVWDAKTEMGTWLSGKGHAKNVSGVAISSDHKLVVRQASRFTMQPCAC